MLCHLPLARNIYLNKLMKISHLPIWSFKVRTITQSISKIYNWQLQYAIWIYKIASEIRHLNYYCSHL